MNKRYSGMEEEACALAEAGCHESASKVFQQAIATSPAKAALHEQLAQCLLEAGDLHAAHEAALRATELAPEVG